MKSIAEKIVPFIFLGVMLVVLTLGIILFSYVLILGAIVGFVLYVIARIREKFFPSKQLMKRDPSVKSGRTFDHDDK